jgi:hypothetical protein
VHFFLADVNEQHAVFAQKVARQCQPSVQEFQPGRVSPRVLLGDKSVVVNEIVVSCVVRRVNQNALYLPGEGHPQVAQSIEVVSLYD